MDVCSRIFELVDKKYVEVMKKLKKDTNVNLKMLVCMDDIKDNEVEKFSQLNFIIQK